MITEKLLYEKVNEEIKAYDEYLLQLSKASLIEDAFEIAKTHAFYDFISTCINCGNGYAYIERLCSIVNEDTPVLASLCEFEFNYDTPKWTTWDDIIELLGHYAEANELCNFIKQKQEGKL